MTTENNDDREYFKQGRIDLQSCGPITNPSSISISVEFVQGYEVEYVKVISDGGLSGISYLLSKHQARALAYLLLETVDQMSKE